MVITRRFVKVNDHNGMAKETDFKMVEEELDENLKEGEILTEAVCISVDPYQRLVAGNPKGDSTFTGLQVAKVLKSRNSKYPQGCLVMQETGWQTVGKSSEDVIWYKVDEKYKDIEPETFLGSAGMPGMTVYFGLNDILKPKSGQTIFINGSAGAVGSIAGQMAKLKGCRVIGSAGSQEKLDYLKSIGYDDAFNYKKEKTPEALQRIAPEGIDLFFDNVGGQMTTDVINKMNTKGRVVICGSISTYNDETSKADTFHKAIIFHQLLIQGVLIFAERDRFPEALEVLLPLIEQGKLKSKETITHGFENIPKTFIGLFHGKNIGKAVVKV